LVLGLVEYDRILVLIRGDDILCLFLRDKLASVKNLEGQSLFISGHVIKIDIQEFTQFVSGVKQLVFFPVIDTQNFEIGVKFEFYAVKKIDF
jgi:hypothetical protein